MAERTPPGEVIYSELQKEIDEARKEFNEIGTQIDSLKNDIVALQDEMKSRLEDEQAHLEFLQSEQQHIKQILMEARIGNEAFKGLKGFETQEEQQQWIRMTQDSLEKFETYLKDAETNREKLIRDYLDEIIETKEYVVKFEEIKLTFEALIAGLAKTDKKTTEALQKIKFKIKH